MISMSGGGICGSGTLAAWLEVNVGTVLLNRECALGPHSDDANILVIKLAVISISGSGKNLVTTASTSPSVCMI